MSQIGLSPRQHKLQVILISCNYFFLSSCKKCKYIIFTIFFISIFKQINILSQQVYSKIPNNKAFYSLDQNCVLEFLPQHINLQVYLLTNSLVKLVYIAIFFYSTKYNVHNFTISKTLQTLWITLDFVHLDMDKVWGLYLNFCPRKC